MDSSFFKKLVAPIIFLGLLAGSYFVGVSVESKKKTRGGSSDDEPIIVSGGSMVIRATPKGDDSQFSFAKDDDDPKKAAHQTDKGGKAKTKNRYASIVDIWYGNTGTPM